MLILISLTALPLQAEQLRIAVASNFSSTLDDLAEEFRKTNSTQVLISPGATGKHVAQILHGAPYDLFFAADAERPALLEKEGRVHSADRFTYAVGQVVLWIPGQSDLKISPTILNMDHIRHIAIAHPELAPYGRAAIEVLSSLDLLEVISAKLVQGANVSQAAQFVHAGAAEAGFIALSQAKQLKGSFWIPPQGTYRPIEQQAVLLRSTVGSEAFVAFLKTESAKAILREHGYRIPVEEDRRAVAGGP